MNVRLLDYRDRKIEFDIGKLKDIITAMMRVVSGDEILDVTYKDGRIVAYDSCQNCSRTEEYYDGCYPVYINPFYMSGRNINLFEKEEWLNREDSYSYLYLIGKDE